MAAGSEKKAAFLLQNQHFIKSFKHLPKHWTAAQKRVYGVLHQQCEHFKSGYFVSFSDLAKIGECSDRTAVTAVQLFEDEGWLIVDHGERVAGSVRLNRNKYSLPRFGKNGTPIRHRNPNPAPKPAKKAKPSKPLDPGMVTGMVAKLLHEQGMEYEDARRRASNLIDAGSRKLGDMAMDDVFAERDRLRDEVEQLKAELAALSLRAAA